MPEISAEAVSRYYLQAQLQLGEIIRSVSQLPDSYFLVAVLVPLIIALAFRDAWGFLWACLSLLTASALLRAKDHASLVLILFLTCSSLLVVVRRVLATARDRRFLRELGKLERRVSILESVAQQEFFQSIRDASNPVPPNVVPLAKSEDPAQNSRH